MLSKSVEDLLNVLQVFHPNFVENEDAIYIYDHKVICVWPQDVIHWPHEICGRISQTKMHDQTFKKTLFRWEGSLPKIGLFYWDLVLSWIQRINKLKQDLYRYEVNIKF